MLAWSRFGKTEDALATGSPTFVLEFVLEGDQRFSPGRAVELGDIVTNGAGVSCVALLGLPIRACIAIL
jgi:VanZ family protein